ncbi:hypothetical protein [Pseudorhodoplanes sp.]|uniref:hypothetical protein n=1 Tax=Pseudorhodoplanes sp. TaxID=1934341 RepID=UPI002CEB4A07|nr:hypothetical protein [Pseudorhodoplanes sp.]HWV54768.1 hypothetical protein [Pseudorhodoplanes sp.]
MAHESSHIALHALALDAELAGSAMACRYLSSDEYEAELIAERRRAGAYRLPLWHRAGPWMVCALAAIAVLCLPLIW